MPPALETTMSEPPMSEIPTTESRSSETPMNRRQRVIGGCFAAGGFCTPVASLLLDPRPLTPRLLIGALTTGLGAGALALAGYLTRSHTEGTTP